MTADQLLQEAIIDLQKRELSTGTRHLVDEAAQLLADGRDIEARALVEKAQAIAVPEVPSKANGATQVKEPIPAEGMAQTIISRLSSRLAQDIASALNEAVEDLHRDFDARVDEAATAFENRLTEITSRLRVISEVQERVGRLEQEVSGSASAAQDQLQLLSASILSLQETDQARRIESEQFSRNISAEFEGISSRVSAQEERIEVLASMVRDLSSKALSVAEQIDRQTGLLRSMQERQAQRAAALNAVLEGISKLREPEPLAAETASAGARYAAADL